MAVTGLNSWLAGRWADPRREIPQAHRGIPPPACPLAICPLALSTVAASSARSVWSKIHDLQRLERLGSASLDFVVGAHRHSSTGPLSRGRDVRRPRKSADRSPSSALARRQAEEYTPHRCTTATTTTRIRNWRLQTRAG